MSWHGKESPMIPQDALQALTALAKAATHQDSHAALQRARAALGPHVVDYEPLLDLLARYSEELGELRRLAGVDSLSGVANRRTFEHAVAREAARHQRTREPFAVILLDLDDLKYRNDHFGHAAGDAALVATARSCEHVVRSTDLVARLGGDEFAVLVPGSSLEGASILAGRLRTTVELARSEYGRLRVSVGVAAVEHGLMSATAIMQAADADLYRDKVSRKRKLRRRAA
jgi:diguanylate cyclase (GGDEF)-like protein